MSGDKQNSQMIQEEWEKTCTLGYRKKNSDF